MEAPITTLDLTIPEHAYFFGFVQGDGHLSRRPHSPGHLTLTIELSARDIDILTRFSAVFGPSTTAHRHRSTNFVVEHHSVRWLLRNQSLCHQMEQLGLPEGRKSLIVAPPTVSYSEIDYWRGLLDADGSLGFHKKNGCPFLSLVTTSDAVKEAYLAFLEKMTGQKRVANRNVRDQAYNLIVRVEDAVKIVSALYYPGCLALDRKLTIAESIQRWTRPSTMGRAFRIQPWTPQEDEIVLTQRLKDAVISLRRTRASVSHRKRCLRDAGRVPLYFQCPPPASC